MGSEDRRQNVMGLHSTSDKSAKLHNIGARSPYGKESSIPTGLHAEFLNSPIQKECWGNAVCLERPLDYVQVTRSKLRRRGWLSHKGVHTLSHSPTAMSDFVASHIMLEDFSVERKCADVTTGDGLGGLVTA